MYFGRYFQTDVSIDFFIPLRRAEAITWKNFVPAVQEGSRLAGTKRFTCNLQDVIYEEFITLPGSRQNGTEFNTG